VKGMRVDEDGCGISEWGRRHPSLIETREALLVPAREKKRRKGRFYCIFLPLKLASRPCRHSPLSPPVFSTRGSYPLLGGHHRFIIRRSCLARARAPARRGAALALAERRGGEGNSLGTNRETAAAAGDEERREKESGGGEGGLAGGGEAKGVDGGLDLARCGGYSSYTSCSSLSLYPSSSSSEKVALASAKETSGQRITRQGFLSPLGQRVLHGRDHASTRLVRSTSSSSSAAAADACH